jgi:hypothetical protein
MKFIEFSHPEGGRMLVHVDHIASATYRPADGDLKDRLGLDIDERQNEIVLFGEQAERTWHQLLKLKVSDVS